MGKKIFLVAPQVKNAFGKSETIAVRKPVNKFSVMPSALCLFLILRSRAKRGVSKDRGPGISNRASSG
jgi:hypothetical protein